MPCWGTDALVGVMDAKLVGELAGQAHVCFMQMAFHDTVASYRAQFTAPCCWIYTFTMSWSHTFHFCTFIFHPPSVDPELMLYCFTSVCVHARACHKLERRQGLLSCEFHCCHMSRMHLTHWLQAILMFGEITSSTSLRQTQEMRGLTHWAR